MENETLLDYFKARGLMRRKPFILLNVMLILFSLTAQMYFIHRSREMGIEVETPEDLLVPVWGAVAVLLANAALIPAIIMRARDAGWPAWALGGLYGAHVFFATLHSLFGVDVLPANAGFVLQGMAILAVIALMVRPSAPDARPAGEPNQEES